VFCKEDISLFLDVELIEPEIIFAQLMLDDAHTQRSNLEVRNDSVKLRETGEAEKYVDNVSCELRASLPVFTQNSSQRTNCCLCVNNTYWSSS